jgi:hypothetical protein
MFSVSIYKLYHTRKPGKKKKNPGAYPGLKNKEANKSIMIFEPKGGFV